MKKIGDGPLYGEGFNVPRLYTLLPYKKLRTLPECKKWLKEYNHGWFDGVVPIGYKNSMKVKFYRRIKLRLCFSGEKFESRHLTIKKFREIVSAMMEGRYD